MSYKNLQSLYARRRSRENLRQAMLLWLAAMIIVGIHCCAHRKLYFGAQASVSETQDGRHE